MAFFTGREIFDAIAMSLVLGFIFMGFFQRRNNEGTPSKSPFSLSPFWMAVAVVAPAIILHELGHKFLAIGFGLEATFAAAYFGLAIGVILRLVKSPIILFVPAYVAFTAGAAPASIGLIALAGPAVNGLIYITSRLILKYHKGLTRTQQVILLATRKVNGLLFILNMIPIPGFDGFHFYKGIWGLFF